MLKLFFKKKAPYDFIEDTENNRNIALPNRKKKKFRHISRVVQYSNKCMHDIVLYYIHLTID